MKTSFYEADEFTGSKGEHWLTLESDYRWQKGDEVWLETGGKRFKVRITWVVMTVRENGEVTRELLGLKL